MIMITKFKNPQNNFKLYESEMVITSLSAGVIMPCRICQHWRIDEAFAHMLYKLHSHVLANAYLSFTEIWLCNQQRLSEG